MEEDICTTPGFFKLLLKALCLREGGLCYAGHPCSNMVWIAKSVHKRTREAPWGDNSCGRSSTKLRFLHDYALTQPGQAKSSDYFNLLSSKV